MKGRTPTPAPPREKGAPTPWLSPKARLAIGLVAITVAWTFLLAAERGFQVRYANPGGIPVRFVQMDPLARAQVHARLHEGDSLTLDEAADPDEHMREFLPGVIVVHGFAGSSTIMTGYTRVLVRAGYGVLEIDLPGHGANPTPYGERALGEVLDRARAFLVDEPEIDPDRIALLGHSMGAGAVLRAGVERPDDYRAVIAVSPVPVDVGPEAPSNLQLQAGSWEPRFLANAREMLEAAGGPSGAFAAGRARELVEVPAAEHLSILFRDASHQGALGWLDATFGADPLAAPSTDRRILWWLLYVVGTMLFVSSMAPGAWKPRGGGPPPGPWRQWVAFGAAPFVATLACWALSGVVDLARLGPVLLAPVPIAWFLVAGLFALLVPFRPEPVSLGQLGRGLLVFAFLWAALGASAGLVWLDWGLEEPRLLIWPIAAFASIPWFTATEALRHEVRGRSRLMWWLAESALIVAALWLLALLVPGLSLIVMLLPILPLFLGFLSVVSGRVNDPWAAGIGCGLFWGWLLVVAFPIVG